MRRNRVRPSIHHFNLLLRAVRDCGLGDAEFARELLAPGQQLQPSVDSARKLTITERLFNIANSGTASGTTMNEAQEPDVSLTNVQSVCYNL
jgi:hypothetical protein